MRIILYLLFFIIFISNNNLYSQTKTIRVFFNDKGPSKFLPGTELYKSTIERYTQRAKIRREKVISNQFFFEDAPVYQPYVDSIKSIGANHIYSLKWKNYSIFRCDSTLIDIIGENEFVKKIQKTNTKMKPMAVGINQDDSIEKRKADIYIDNDETNELLQYGGSFKQINLMGADKLHSLGIKGDSVLFTVMDSGFRWRKHDAINKSNVIFEYDFLQMDSTASNEEMDVPSQDGHGTLCFSAIGANSPGKLIGVSPKSDFILFKTESIPLEILLEEDNYAAAMELADEMGADITSSSLAYVKFDSTDESYEFDEIDGKTSISAEALNEAVKRGIVCVTAAGNTGPNERTLLTPADADSAVAVGAVRIAEGFMMPARFTSRGPRADNEIKPDISALGVKVYCAAPGDNSPIITANGTSLATPLVAGAIGLLLSAFPELMPWEVRELIYSTASRYPLKNNINGYGIINIWDAMRKAGTIISPPIFENIKEDSVKITVNIVPNASISDTPKLIGRNYEGTCSYYFEYPLEKSSTEFEYFCYIPTLRLFDNQLKMYITVATDKGNRRYPYDETKFFYSK